MKLLILLLTILFATSCTKINEGVINTDSTPYYFGSLSLFSNPEEDVLLTYFTFPHPNLDIDYLYQSAYFNKVDTISDNRKLRFFTNFVLGYPIFKQDQSNFKIDKYSNAKSIFQLNVFDDFNNNGFMDEVFQIEYEDSTVIQIRDHFIMLNPKSKNDTLSDILSEFTLLKQPTRLSNFKKEDNHNIRFMFYWKPANDKKYLVFNKDNRLTRKKYIDLDSLLILDVLTGEVRSIKVSVPISPVSLDFPTSEKDIFLFSGTPMNGHNWDTLKDYNIYLLKLSFSNANHINLHVVTQLTDINKNESRAAIFEDDETVYFVRSIITEKAQQKYILEKYLKKDGSLTFKSEIDWQDASYFTYHKIDGKIKFYFEDNVLIYNPKSNKVTEENLPINLKIDYIRLAMHDVNSYLPKDLRIRTDVNGNGYNDLFITTNENQLICLDGKTNEILASSKKYNEPINWSVGRIQNEKFTVFIYNNNFSESFLLKPNSFISRISTHIPQILLVISIFLVPIILYILYSFYLLTIFFVAFTQKNNYLGFAILRDGFISKNIKILKSNHQFFEILSIPNVTKITFGVLPPELQKNIKADLDRKDGGIYQISIKNDKLKHITFTTFIVRPFLSKKYCILTIQDETQIIKSQLTDLYMAFVHKSSNELGVIYNRFKDLIYKINKDYELDSKMRQNKDIILNGIMSIANSMKALLQVTKMEITKENLDFAQLVLDWYTKHQPMLSSEDIQIHINLDNVGKYLLNKSAIHNILESAVMNSIQSKVENRLLKIIISLTHDEEFIYLEIIDTGIGMTPEYLMKITNWNDVSPTKGTGLGLKLIKKSCEFHNAELTIQSEYMVGTVLKIRFRK